MPDLLKFQTQFKQGILTQEAEVPEGLFDETGTRAQIGWQVYQNNVFHSLIEALGETFPVVRRLVGDDFFKFSAREFIKAHAPKSPILLELGETYPAYLESLEAAQNHAYLADVARLEYAWLTAYHAEDVTSLDPKEVQDLEPEEIPNLKFTFDPSVQLLTSAYPIFSIWQAHQSDKEPEALSLDKGAEHVLMFREGLEVLIQEVTLGEFAFWAALHDDQTLGQAFAIATAQDPELDLSQVLAFGLTNELFTAFNF